MALAVAEKLHIGAVVINGTSDVRIDSKPFGGFKKYTVINLAGAWSHWEQPGGLAERTTA